MEPLVKDMTASDARCNLRKNWVSLLSSLLKPALDGYLAGIVTREELDLVLSISSLQSVLDTTYIPSFVRTGTKPVST
jgi:hypothetical protein